MKKRNNDRKKRWYHSKAYSKAILLGYFGLQMSYACFSFAGFCLDNPLRICFITTKSCEALFPKI